MSEIACGKPFATQRVFIVVVLYRLHPRDSQAFQSIQQAIAATGRPAGDFHVLLFDNSPGAVPEECAFDGVTYVRAERNEGVAGAYNHALRMASAEGFAWLLTLDQDTTVPANFLVDMTSAADRYADDQTVAAIVPRLYDCGRLLSPNRITAWGNASLPADFSGFPPGEVHALNSASLFRVSSLEELGGFSTDFWLDFLDAWVYGQIFRAGKRIYVAGNISVEHELSLLDFSNKVSPERFSNILQAESAYMDLYASGIGRVLYNGRIMARLYSVQKRKRGRAITLATWELLKQRLFQSRRTRINAWLHHVRQRSSQAGAA